MVSSAIPSRFIVAKAAARFAGIALIAAAALPAQAAYVAESRQDALAAAAAALRDRLAATGEEGSFIAAGGKAQPSPDADALLPVVAVPMPEPETYALLLAGIGLVGWASRRRQRG